MSGNSHDISHAGDATQRNILNDTFRMFYRRLCLFAFKLTGDVHTAEDVVQDCFVRAWEERKNIVSDDLLPYLYTLVKNTCLRHLKETAGKYLEPDVLLPDDSPDIVQAETMHLIYEAIESLPPQCKNVMELILFDKKSSPQIARLLHLDQSTVRTQKARGLAVMRNKLRQLIMLLIP